MVKPHAAVRRLLTTPVLFLAIAACSTTSEQAVTSGPGTRSCPEGTGRQIVGFPNQRLSCLSGPGSMRISVTDGRPEVINVWASWCYPCRQELDLLERTHRRLGSQVLFVGVDEKDRPAPAVKLLGDHGVTYPQVMDPDGRFARALGFSGVPDTIAVDAAGHVVYRHKGQLTAAAVDDLVRALGVRSQG